MSLLTNFHLSFFINVSKVIIFIHFLTLTSLIISVFRGMIELGEITTHNIKQLRRINEVVFPVVYNDKFYKDLSEVGELAKLGKCFKMYFFKHSLPRQKMYKNH